MSAYTVFESVGDAAKDLMGTAVVSALKKAQPEREIVVVTLHPEVWLHNPAVHRVYRLGSMAYFYDDFVKDKDVLILRHDPYTTTDYLYSRKHLIEIWCDLCKVPYNGELPNLHFTWREREAAQKLTTSNKPLFFIHATTSADQKLPTFWAKDIPIALAQAVVNEMNKRGYQTVQLRDPHHPMLGGASTLDFNLRQTLCAIQFAKKRLFVDSFASQTAAAFGLPAVIAYVTGDPKLTGYKTEKSLKALEHLNKEGMKSVEKLAEYIDSYKEGYDIAGAMRMSPFPLESLFSLERIITALESDQGDQIEIN